MYVISGTALLLWDRHSRTTPETFLSEWLNESGEHLRNPWEVSYWKPVMIKHYDPPMLHWGYFGIVDPVSWRVQHVQYLAVLIIQYG